MILHDTSGLFCLHSGEEPRHEEAKALFDSAGSKLVTSYVLAEFVALIEIRRGSRLSGLEFADALATQPDVVVVWIDEDLHREGMELLVNRIDKSWSLCDAVSFVLMQRREVTEALTTDHHFEQAGFVRLLRP